MYIAPNSIIKALKNVPLDPTYDHTIYFANTSAQTAFFESKAKTTFLLQTYQRLNKGRIRVKALADNLYDCNYLMFQNTSYGSKWFYAFIKSVEYINNEVTEIEYEIDVMQTWFFDYTLDKCFVEREHSANDDYFSNIVSENVEIGDEYVCKAHDVYDMNSMYVCALINRESQAGTAISRKINNIYTPLNIIAGIPVSDTSSIDTALDQFLESEIVAVYQYPSQFGDASTETDYSNTKTITAVLTDFGGYIPHNRKLYTYPYCCLIVSNNTGQVAQYRWEDWSSNMGLFTIRGVFISTPSVICYPKYYRGMTDAYDEGLVLSNFPQCPWSGDTFKAWWAQNKASFVTSGITSVVGSLTTIGAGAAISIATGNPVAGVAGFVSGINNIGKTVSNSIAKIDDMKNAPSQAHGQTQTDSLNPGMGRVQYDFYQMQIKREYAEIIDGYFDRFGYATKKNKVPNRNVRPHWTYTQTVGCTITGSIPADDAISICNIYNNGITFWNNGNEVGNYTLNNSLPISA